MEHGHQKASFYRLSPLIINYWNSVLLKHLPKLNRNDKKELKRSNIPKIK